MLDMLDIDTSTALLEDAARRRDPCECNDLRSRLATAMRQVVATLKNALRSAIADNDMLGLNGLHPHSWAANTRMDSFNAYAASAMKRLTETASGSAVSGLRASYDRGIKKARKELDITNNLPGQYVINALTLTVQNDVAAIAHAVQAGLTKQAQLSIAAKDTAFQAYRRMEKDVVKRIAAARLDIMAATLITAGYNNGKLDVYDNAGQNEVSIIAESFPHFHKHHDHATDDSLNVEIEDARRKVLRTPTGRVRTYLPRSRAQLVTLLTAGDDRVCDICEDLEGTTYTVAYARRLIPVHPRCRCVVVPAGDKRFKPVPFTRKEDVVKRKRKAA